MTCVAPRGVEVAFSNRMHPDACYTGMTSPRGILADSPLCLTHQDGSSVDSDGDDDMGVVGRENIMAALRESSNINPVLFTTSMIVETTVVFRGLCAIYLFALMRNVKFLRLGATLSEGDWATFLLHASLPKIQALYVTVPMPFKELMSFIRRHRNTLMYISVSITYGQPPDDHEMFDMNMLKELAGPHSSLFEITPYLKHTPSLERICFEAHSHDEMPPLDAQIYTLTKFAETLVEAKLALCTTDPANVDLLADLRRNGQELACFRRLTVVELRRRCCEGEREDFETMVSRSESNDLSRSMAVN